MQETEPEITPEQKKQEGKSPFLSAIIKDILEVIILSVVLFFGINFVTARIRVDGFSMEPSLHTGELVIVNRLAYRFGSPSRGDVIIFHPPVDPGQEYIKRVIGLPGDQIKIENGEVMVNGELLSEPYIAAAPAYQGDFIVGDHELFVLGDNRNNSSDSHNWGPVPLDSVVGKAIIVYWPPTDWGLIEHTETVNAAP